MRDLDREHRKIFGHGMKSKMSALSKRHGHHNFDKGEELKYKTNVWQDRRREREVDRFPNPKRTNWSFLAEFDGKSSGEKAQNTEPKEQETYRMNFGNRRYRGNGMVNLSPKMMKKMKRQQDKEYRRSKRKRGRNRNENEKNDEGMPKYVNGRRLTSYQRAKMEGQKAFDEKEEFFREIEEKKKEKEERLAQSEQKRKKRQRIHMARNKKGQPSFGGQIGMLLNKLKHNQDTKDEMPQEKESAEEKKDDDAGDLQQTTEFSDDSGIDDFLEDRETDARSNPFF